MVMQAWGLYKQVLRELSGAAARTGSWQYEKIDKYIKIGR